MTIRKCDHAVYIELANETNRATYCQQCNPDGGPNGPVPVLPRGPLAATRSAELATCTCGNVRTYFSNVCQACGLAFPEDDADNRAQEAANNQQAGSCPSCSSSIHYETKKKGTWECSECGTEYPAPKKRV